jgi:hypothetical protein
MDTSTKKNHDDIITIVPMQQKDTITVSAALILASDNIAESINYIATTHQCVTPRRLDYLANVELLFDKLKEK